MRGELRQQKICLSPLRRNAFISLSSLRYPDLCFALLVAPSTLTGRGICNFRLHLQWRGRARIARASLMTAAYLIVCILHHKKMLVNTIIRFAGGHRGVDVSLISFAVTPTPYGRLHVNTNYTDNQTSIAPFSVSSFIDDAGNSFTSLPATKLYWPFSAFL